MTWISRRVGAALTTACFLLASASCSNEEGDAKTPPETSASSTAAASASSTVVPASPRGPAQTWPITCSDSVPCDFEAGKYVLREATVVPGLRLSLPAGWSSSTSDYVEFNIHPTAHPDERLLMWLDMAAVKSSGPGHGAVLPDVGGSPTALVSWLTHNPDFEIVSPPTTVTVAKTMTMTVLDLAVSDSANYGDPECPANPRCADLFTRPDAWGPSAYGIGDGEIRLYIGRLPRGTGPGPLSGHTFIIDLDASGHDDLRRLVDEASPIIDSLRLPTV